MCCTQLRARRTLGFACGFPPPAFGSRLPLGTRPPRKRGGLYAKRLGSLLASSLPETAKSIIYAAFRALQLRKQLFCPSCCIHQLIIRRLQGHKLGFGALKLALGLRVQSLIIGAGLLLLLPHKV